MLKRVLCLDAYYYGRSNSGYTISPSTTDSAAPLHGFIYTWGGFMKLSYIYNLAFDLQVIICRQRSLPIRRQRSHVAYTTWHSAVRCLFVGKAPIHRQCSQVACGGKPPPYIPLKRTQQRLCAASLTHVNLWSSYIWPLTVRWLFVGKALYRSVIDSNTASMLKIFCGAPIIWVNHYDYHISYHSR